MNADVTVIDGVSETVRESAGDETENRGPVPTGDRTVRERSAASSSGSGGCSGGDPEDEDGQDDGSDALSVLQR